MTSVNSKNIFDVVKKKYAPNQPEKNHKIDPVYSLFAMIRFRSARNSLSSPTPQSVPAAKRAKLPASNGTSWNPIPTIGPAIATTTQAIFLPTTGVM